MKNLRTWLVLSGFILLAISLERFYRQAISYDPLIAAPGLERTTSNAQVIQNTEKDKPKPEKGILINLFGIEEIRMPEKPLTTVAPPPPPPPEPPPQIILKGVILEPDGRYRAYIEIDGRKILSLRAGEGVDNITITDIKERSVSLRWKDQSMELSIEPKRR
ncbi:MAG: hypothetical protein N2257_05165 [Thermodesulfovibrionales bacterium]|nr:hypothetical protein [Thermodesulfovibrionales bacterium]